MSKQRLALFDFCNTLTSFQTADRFVDFVVEDQWTPRRRRQERVRKILSALRLLPGEKNKRFKLRLLRNVPKQRIDERAATYLDQIISPSLRGPVLNLLKQHTANGDRVVLISGAYEPYLKLFAENTGVDFIGTKMKFADGVCQGTIDGLNCMGENKVALLKARYNLIDFDLTESFAYSDDASDVPLLKLVGHGVVVATTPQVPWAEAHGFRVIDVRTW